MFTAGDCGKNIIVSAHASGLLSIFLKDQDKDLQGNSFPNLQVPEPLVLHFH